MIDFVAPYFDQSGISILLRRKEPKQSIFKFMQVRNIPRLVFRPYFKIVHGEFTYIKTTLHTKSHKTWCMVFIDPSFRRANIT